MRWYDKDSVRGFFCSIGIGLMVLAFFISWKSASIMLFAWWMDNLLNRKTKSWESKNE